MACRHPRMTRAANRLRTISVFAAVLAIATLASCSNETAGEACARGPIFAAARARAERSVAEIDTTSTIELEESLNALVDQLLVLRDVSPSELRDPLGTLLAAYGQLVVALDDIGWDPQSRPPTRLLPKHVRRSPRPRCLMRRTKWRRSSTNSANLPWGRVIRCSPWSVRRCRSPKSAKSRVLTPPKTMLRVRASSLRSDS